MKYNHVIQSILGIYLASGLPYRTINDSKTLDKKTTAESYLDYLGRPAITLYLEGNELREKFPALEKKDYLEE